jgi:hypothetical protein
MWQDLRVAWRFLLKQRATTIVTIATLGIAIGAGTIASGALDSAFWRSIQTSTGSSLLTFYNTRPAAPQYQTLSYSDFVSLRDGLRDHVDVAAFFRTFNTLEGIAQPTTIQGELVSDNYFRVLAAAPLAGRLIGDDATKHTPVVVLSYNSWRNRFGGDPNVIGSAIQLGRDQYTVIGVARPDFDDPAYPSEFWVPLTATPQLIGVDLQRELSRHFRRTGVRDSAHRLRQCGGAATGASNRARPRTRGPAGAGRNTAPIVAAPCG